MKTLPIVSVIIPTYNRRILLQEAIDSVLSQTYQNFEIIVIDDGSTDGTGDLLKARYGNRINYIWQENQGESVARNHAINLTKGDYVAFLDSDDIWKVNKLERQVGLMEESGDEVALVFSSCININQDGKVKSSKPVGRYGTRELKISDFAFSHWIYGPCSNILVKTKCVKEIGGFDAAIQYGEDWLLIAELAARWKILYIDEPLFCYRDYANNQQSAPNIEKINQILIDSLRIIEKISTYIDDDRIIQKANSRRFERAAFTCFLQGFTAEGITYLLQAGCYDHERISSSSFVTSAIQEYISAWIIKYELQFSPNIKDFIYDQVSNILKNWPCRKIDSKKIFNEALGLIYYNLLYKSNALPPRLKAEFIIKSFLYHPGQFGVRKLISLWQQ